MLERLDLSNIYTPHAGQEYLHSVDKKVKVLEVGRRWGKSRFALWELIKRYIETIAEPAPASLIPPFHAWIIAPSYPQARQVWNELIAFMPQEFITPGGIHQDSHMIYLRGSEVRSWGLIEVKSAHDPDSLQTAGIDFLWVTESQDIADKAFEKVLPVLRSPGRKGYAVFEGIPSLWMDHWFHRTFLAAESGAMPNALAYKASSFENPLMTEEHKAEIEMDKEILMEATWRRMYLAEFSESAGYFKNVTDSIAGDLLPEPLAGAEYVGGLDLGRKVDASVLIIMDAHERKVVSTYAWDDGTNWVLQREAIVRIAKQWGLSRLVIDATGMGGDIFTQELQEANMPVEPYILTASSRSSLLQELAVAMERGTVSFPSVPMLLRQLRAFQYRKMPGGTYRVEAPPGEHDDWVFAFALALTACAEAPRITPKLMRMRSMRYAPTSDDVASGQAAKNSRGARMMRERRLDRIQERIDLAGV